MAWRDYIHYVTAAAAGGAGLYFLGYDRKKGVFKEGMEPWACLLGGALVGFVGGRVVQTALAKAPAAGLQAMPLPSPLPTGPISVGEYLDLEVDVPRAPRRALPAPNIAPPAPPKRVDVRAVTTDDATILNDMGAYATSGEDGLGSYDSGLDVDELDEHALLRESGYKVN